MKVLTTLLLAASALTLSQCTYNSYPTVEKKTYVAPTTRKASSSDKPASVSHSGSSPEGFQAISKPSSYSN